MNYLRALVVAGCLMMMTSSASLAQGGAFTNQFGKQLNPSDKKLAKQLAADGAPQTVPLSQFNNVFQDYLDQTPKSSGFEDPGNNPYAAGNQFGPQSGGPQSGSPPVLYQSGNQWGSQSGHQSGYQAGYQSGGSGQFLTDRMANQFDARGRRGGGRRGKIKQKFDTNGDGVLDDNERAQMREWRKQHRGNRKNGGMGRRGRRGQQNQGGGPGAGFSGFGNNGFGSNGFGSNGFGN